MSKITPPQVTSATAKAMIASTSGSGLLPGLFKVFAALFGIPAVVNLAMFNLFAAIALGLMAWFFWFGAKKTEQAMETAKAALYEQALMEDARVKATLGGTEAAQHQ